ncbi:MAG TPA: hypothetical protein VK427_27330 [Kofleriaceae bacterium]|nr:hypothetical protein [Kofleriaceae bacterium]
MKAAAGSEEQNVPVDRSSSHTIVTSTRASPRAFASAIGTPVRAAPVMDETPSFAPTTTRSAERGDPSRTRTRAVPDRDHAPVTVDMERRTAVDVRQLDRPAAWQAPPQARSAARRAQATLDALEAMTPSVQLDTTWRWRWSVWIGIHYGPIPLGIIAVAVLWVLAGSDC